MSNATTTKKPGSSKSSLAFSKVRYKYIPRQIAGVTDSKHPLFDGRLDGTIDKLHCVRSAAGQFNLHLTEAEAVYITEGLGLSPGDLNVNDRKNEFLSEFMIELPKYGLNLDTKDPYDMLKDKVLLGYDNYIAPNVQSIPNKGSYRFVRIEGTEETAFLNQKSDQRKEAYKLLGTLEESRERMVMYILNSGARVHPQISADELKRLVNDTVEKSYGKFISTLGDEMFNEKGMLHMAVVMGIVELRSNMYYYESVPLAFEGEVATLPNAAVYIKDKANGDIRLAISKKTLDQFNK